jgi:hypothetical protein
MPSVSVTGRNILMSLFVLAGIQMTTYAQENIPLSRYGLGDAVPSSNILNRGMGYVSAAYNDQQTINFNNPASYSRFGSQKAILDIGMDIHSRTLRNNSNEKFTNTNVIVPYVAGAFQLRGEKRKRNWGVAFGLRPLSRVNYQIETGSRIGRDSIIYNYQGNGGLYQAFAGTGIAFKNLSIGVNIGYRFGSKDYTTRVSMINDTIGGRYTSGQKEVRNNFGGFFTEWGIQYETKLSPASRLTLGAFGSFATGMNATTQENISTFFQANSGSDVSLIDSVRQKNDIRGSILYPAFGGIGVMYDHVARSRLMVGADFSFQNWDAYRYFNTPDLLRNSWQIKTGVQWLPDAEGKSKKMWSSMMYRAGVIYQIEPYAITEQLNSIGLTLGASIPIKKYSYSEYNRNNVIHIGFEVGRRGNDNTIIKERYIRLALSASLSDIWFIKSKYD